MADLRQRLAGMSSPSLREEHQLNVLTRIFGLERKEEARCSTQLHNEASHNLQLSLSNIMMAYLRYMRWAGHVAHTEQQTKSYTLSV